MILQSGCWEETYSWALSSPLAFLPVPYLFLRPYLARGSVIKRKANQNMGMKILVSVELE